MNLMWSVRIMFTPCPLPVPLSNLNKKAPLIQLIYTSFFDIQDVIPLFHTHPPYSPNGTWYRVEIWHEQSSGEVILYHRGDFQNLTPGLRYGGERLHPWGAKIEKKFFFKFPNFLLDSASMTSVHDNNTQNGHLKCY